MVAALPAEIAQQGAEVLYPFWPKQWLAWETLWNEGIEQMLYGGAAGGGKSYFHRGTAAVIALLWPGSYHGIFRRTDTELTDNHIRPWKEELMPRVQGGIFQEQKNQYVWPSPDYCACEPGAPCVHSSITAFRHVDQNRGVYKYQGAEFSSQGIDEAGHFHGWEIEFLYTRVRATDRQRARWENYRRLQLLTANPGDVGHTYNRETYVDPVDKANTKIIGLRRSLKQDPECKVWSVEVDISRPGRPKAKHRIKRAYIPARVDDNFAIDADEYAAGLAAGSEEQKLRLLAGDWSYFAGKALAMLDPKVHYVDLKRLTGVNPFTGAAELPPPAWDRVVGLDHGRIHPTACLWTVRDPEGYYIVYMEYVSPGPALQHAKAIRDRQLADQHPDLIIEADPQMWRKNQGVKQTYAIADIYKWIGEPPIGYADQRRDEPGLRLHKSSVERIAGFEVLANLFDLHDDLPFPEWHPLAGQSGSPQLFVATTCPETWRVLNGLRHPKEEDGGNQEDVEKEDDDPYDALRFSVPLLHRRTVRPRQRRRGPVQLRVS